MQRKDNRLKIPKRTGFREIGKIYDYLQEAKIVSFADSIKNKTQFVDAFKKSEPQIQKLLYLVRYHGVRSIFNLLADADVSTILTHSNGHKTVRLNFSYDKSSRSNWSLQLEKLTVAKSTGALSWTPIKPDKFSYHIKDINKRRTNTKDDFVHSMTGSLIDDAEVLLEAILQYIRFLRDAKKMIDMHETNSWDDMLLWYATYHSDKSGKTDFKGYVITWEKVHYMVQNGAQRVIEVCNAFISENGHHGKLNFWRDSLDAFQSKMEHYQQVEVPIGRQYPVKLSEVRVYVESGGHALDMLGDVAMAGVEYLEIFQKIYEIAVGFAKTIQKGSAKYTQLSRKWEDMVNRILRTNVK